MTQTETYVQEDEFAAKPRKKREVSCRDYALNLLNRQGHSSAALRDKLVRKKYNAEEIKTVLEEMQSLKYLNDQVYAETYFENLKKYRSFGFFGIKKKLMDKKIDKTQIEALMKTLSSAEELEIAKKVVEKAKSKTYEQKARMLQSRGFRGAILGKALGPRVFVKSTIKFTRPLPKARNY